MPDEKPLETTVRKQGPNPSELLLPALYTRRDVATLLRCCTETVKRLERRGLLPALKINARVTRYEPEAVEALIIGARVVPSGTASRSSGGHTE